MIYLVSSSGSIQIDVPVNPLCPMAFLESERPPDVCREEFNLNPNERWLFLNGVLFSQNNLIVSGFKIVAVEGKNSLDIRKRSAVVENNPAFPALPPQ